MSACCECGISRGYLLLLVTLARLHVITDNNLLKRTMDGESDVDKVESESEDGDLQSIEIARSSHSMVGIQAKVVC